ncbi:hypothetical protein [Vibrio alginolyticus]|uniref:hypothetical protein n=1 Tax=Vibrio alginolyticus TaxID=663 RepID=UPI003D7EB0DC
MNENINTSELLEVFPEDFLDALEEKHDPFAHGQGAILAITPCIIKNKEWLVTRFI